MHLPSNELLIFLSTVCSSVKITLYCLNPILVLKLCAAVALHSIISLFANSLSIKILLDCLFGSSTISYVCFLWSEKYFFYMFLQLFLHHFFHAFFYFQLTYIHIHCTKTTLTTAKLGKFFPFFVLFSNSFALSNNIIPPFILITSLSFFLI